MDTQTDKEKDTGTAGNLACLHEKEDMINVQFKN